MVVKGCAAQSAREESVNALKRVDLPAEGFPTRPATNFQTLPFFAFERHRDDVFCEDAEVDLAFALPSAPIT